MTVTISQSFEAISDLAHNAGFTAAPFGAGWGYASNGTRWVGRTFTRGHSEVGMFADADGVVTGGTLRIADGRAGLLEPVQVAGALLHDWPPLSLVKGDD